MSTLEKIQSALKGILTVYPYRYDGKATTYGVVTFTDEPDCFADDDPQALVASVTLQVFLPLKSNYFDVKHKVVKALKSVDTFTYPLMTYNDVVDGSRRLVFEFEDDEEAVEI